MFWPVDGIFSPNTLLSEVSGYVSDRATIAFSQWLRDSIGSMGKLETSPKNGARKSVGWQAEKSTMMQGAILESAIDCFIDLGYSNTTTAKIAEYAKVSRGAMMHHFPSRLRVLQAAIEYLHKKRLQEYDTLMANIDAPDRALSREVFYESVQMAWRYANLPSFTAYQEILAASRTDRELAEFMAPVERDFENQYREHAKSMFPHWSDLGEYLDLAIDVVVFTTQGMALSHMVQNKEARVDKMLNFITDQLQLIYGSAVSES